MSRQDSASNLWKYVSVTIEFRKNYIRGTSDDLPLAGSITTTIAETDRMSKVWAVINQSAAKNKLQNEYGVKVPADVNEVWLYRDKQYLRSVKVYDELLRDREDAHLVVWRESDVDIWLRDARSRTNRGFCIKVVMDELKISNDA